MPLVCPELGIEFVSHRGSIGLLPVHQISLERLKRRDRDARQHAKSENRRYDLRGQRPHHRTTLQ